MQGLVMEFLTVNRDFDFSIYSFVAMRIRDRVNRCRLFAAIIAISLVYPLFIIYYELKLETRDSGGLKKNDSTVPASLNSSTKTILFWNTMFGNEDFYFGRGDIFHDCPEAGKNCWATHERSYANVESFDAILFHGYELDLKDVPATRRESQNYVFVDLESPENPMSVRIPHQIFDRHFFNSTMTYRLDSDIRWSDGDVRSLRDGNIVAPKLKTLWDPKSSGATDLAVTNSSAMTSVLDESAMIKIRRNKKKTAVWFVSNCQARSKRENYVNELAKHVDVEIYGLCGKEIRCPINWDCFRRVVEPDYYFYLSFENSFCQDYVTEKFYNALKHNVVPIVYGGANYSLFAPPRSYINALDFDSPKQLAIYLKTLISQPTEYDKYFEWKNHYEIVKSNHRVACQLCQYLHEHNGTKSYQSMSVWYERDKCLLQEKLKNSSYLTKGNLSNRR